MANGGVIIKKLTEQQEFIRKYLSQKSKMVKVEKLVKDLGVTDKTEFIKDLNALEHAGEIIISQKGNVRSVEGAGLVRGKIVSASRNFSFMQPEGGGEDVYIPYEYNGGALPGDGVIISVREDEKGPSGKVLSVFERGSRLVIGTVKKYRGKLELLADAD